jgi:hypothetical protein
MRSIIALVLFCIVASVFCLEAESHPACSKSSTCPTGWKCQKDEVTNDCLCCPRCAPPGRSDILCKVVCKKCVIKDD